MATLVDPEIQKQLLREGRKTVQLESNLLFDENHLPHYAVNKQQVGPFTHYYFRDGGHLIVRTKHEKELYKKHTLIAIPGFGTILPRRAEIHKRRGRPAVVKKPGPYETSTFLENYGQVLASGARFEIPIAWLTRNRQQEGQTFNGFLITKALRGYRPLFEAVHNKSTRFKQLVAETLATELGTIHGAGVQHSHPHGANLLVHRSGNGRIIDPKLFTSLETESTYQIKAPFSREHLQDAAEKAGAKRDLAIFEGSVAYTDNKNKINWQRVKQAYLKGVETGRKNLATFKEKYGTNPAILMPLFFDGRQPRTYRARSTRGIDSVAEVLSRKTGA